MSKNLFKIVGVGAMCLAGMAGLVGCKGNTPDPETPNTISIDVVDSSIPTTIKAGEFDSSEIQMTVNYDDSTTKTIKLTKDMVKAEDQALLELPGTHLIRINYGGEEDTILINITLNESLLMQRLGKAYNYLLENDHVITAEEVSEEGDDEIYKSLYQKRNDNIKVAMYFNDDLYMYQTNQFTIEPCHSDVNSTSKDNFTISYGTFPKSYYALGNLFTFEGLQDTEMYSRQFSIEIKNNNLLYTATFTSLGDKDSYIISFDNTKITSIKQIETISSAVPEEYITNYKIEYRTIQDNEVSLDLIPADFPQYESYAKNLMKQYLEDLRSKDFTIQQINSEQSTELTNNKTYSHTKNTNVLTCSGEKDVLLSELDFMKFNLEKITKYREIWYYKYDDNHFDFGYLLGEEFTETYGIAINYQPNDSSMYIRFEYPDESVNTYYITLL